VVKKLAEINQRKTGRSIVALQHCTLNHPTDPIPADAFVAAYLADQYMYSSTQPHS